VPVDEIDWMLEQVSDHYRVGREKHFHETPAAAPWLPLGLQLDQDAVAHGGLVERAEATWPHRPQAGEEAVHRHDAAPDGSRFAWLAGSLSSILIVTMDDAQQRGLLGVSGGGRGHASDAAGAARRVHGQGASASSIREPRQPLLLHAQGGEAVDKERLPRSAGHWHGSGSSTFPLLTGGAWAKRADVRHAAGPPAKELTLAGIGDVEAATASYREVYLPAHNARLRPLPTLPESAFVVADPAVARDLCVQGAHRGARQHGHASAGSSCNCAKPMRPHT